MFVFTRYVAGMCSEYARRLTFITWPHYSYKWAKPDSMAKAGFYHTKGAHNGKDGVQCFKCRINLVKWEASDEPWNEHEQHSPNCLFLKGESTHNVPIANTVAFRLVCVQITLQTWLYFNLELLGECANDDYACD